MEEISELESLIELMREKYCLIVNSMDEQEIISVILSAYYGICHFRKPI